MPKNSGTVYSTLASSSMFPPIRVPLESLGDTSWALKLRMELEPPRKKRSNRGTDSRPHPTEYPPITRIPITWSHSTG